MGSSYGVGGAYDYIVSDQRDPPPVLQGLVKQGGHLRTLATLHWLSMTQSCVASGYPSELQLVLLSWSSKYVKV